MRRSSALLFSDMKPAVFWSKTPSNFWRDNVGCHSRAFGFWFEFVEMTEDGNCPSGQDTGEVVNMTVYGNGGIGFRIYPIWLPSVDPCNGASGPSDNNLYGLTSFHNGGNGIFAKQHGAIHHHHYALVENGGDEISIVKLENVNYDSNPHFVDVLIVGSLDPRFDSTRNLGKFGIFGPQREFFYVKNATFVNMGSSGAITGCNECLVGSEMNQGGFTTRYEGLKFVNSTLRIYWSPTKKEILWDLDGTLAGVPGAMITRLYKHLQWNDVCSVLQPESVYSDSILCGGPGKSARIRRMQIEGVSPSVLSYTDVIARSATGEDSFYFLPLDTYGWVFPVVTGANRSYWLDWRASGSSAYTIKYTLGRDAYLRETIAKYPTIDETVSMNYQPHL